MQLIKTSALSALSTFTKILVGLLTLKIVALYTGPKGVAILGQFTSFIGIFGVIAGGGIGLGVIKYVAEYSEDKFKLQKFLSSAFLFTLCFSLVALIIGIIFNRIFSKWILGTEQYGYLIVWLAISQFFIAFNLLICAVINGRRQIKRLVLINVLSSLGGLVLIILMIQRYAMQGALVGLLLFQSVGCFVAIIAVYRQYWFPYLFKLKFEKRYLIDLFHYSFMNIISTLMLPVAQIMVRNDLSHLYGWEQVGYWQAVTRISDAYLIFITMALTAYYLPKLSEIKNIYDIKQEIKQAYQIIIPCIFVMLLILFFLKDFIILILYSSRFEPARNLFLFQYVGDFFRISGWLFAYLLLAKSMVKTYITTEIILGVSFVLISHVLVRKFGLIGVTYAFATTYLFYWAVMYIIAIFYFKTEEGKWLPITSL